MEGYHARAKWLQFGGEIIQENDPEEQQKRIRYLAVLASAVIYWNVVEMTRVLNELAQEGYAINKTDIAYLSPYLTCQLKRFGDYGIQTELAPGPIDYTLGLARRMPVRGVQTRLPFLAEAEAK